MAAVNSANHVTSSQEEGFVRSTWCLSTFSLPEAHIAVLPANPRMKTHSSGHSTQVQSSSTQLTTNRGCVIVHSPHGRELGRDAQSTNCAVTVRMVERFTGSLHDRHGWSRRTVCFQAGVTHFPEMFLATKLWKTIGKVGLLLSRKTCRWNDIVWRKSSTQEPWEKSWNILCSITRETESITSIRPAKATLNVFLPKSCKLHWLQRDWNPQCKLYQSLLGTAMTFNGNQTRIFCSNASKVLWIPQDLKTVSCDYWGSYMIFAPKKKHFKPDKTLTTRA